MLEFSTEISKKNIVCLRISGDLLGLEQELVIPEAVAEHLALKRHCFVFDISQIQHINSTGLSLLIRIYNLLESEQGRLILANPSPHVVRLLRITKLNQVFETVESAEEGINLLSECIIDDF